MSYNEEYAYTDNSVRYSEVFNNTDDKAEHLKILRSAG